MIALAVLAAAAVVAALVAGMALWRQRQQHLPGNTRGRPMGPGAPLGSPAVHTLQHGMGDVERRQGALFYASDTAASGSGQQAIWTKITKI